MEIKNNIYYLKRILKDKEIIIIKIFNDEVEFNVIRNNKIIYINNFEKNIIVNDIIKHLNCNMLINFINFDKLSQLLHNSYINYSNNILGLSVINNNLINIILLKTNNVIGNIKIDYNVNINVDEKYLKDSLDLLSEYDKSKKILKLIKK